MPWPRNTSIRNVEDEVHKLSPEQVENYLTQEKVDVVVNQQAIFSTSFTKLVLGFNLRRFKYISVFHNTPAIYEKTLTFSRLWYNFLHQRGVSAKIIFHLLWRKLVYFVFDIAGIIA